MGANTTIIEVALEVMFRSQVGIEQLPNQVAVVARLDAWSLISSLLTRGVVA